jgi:hypothetical protein
MIKVITPVWNITKDIFEIASIRSVTVSVYSAKVANAYLRETIDNNSPFSKGGQYTNIVR